MNKYIIIKDINTDGDFSYEYNWNYKICDSLEIAIQELKKELNYIISKGFDVQNDTGLKKQLISVFEQILKYVEEYEKIINTVVEDGLITEKIWLNDFAYWEFACGNQYGSFNIEKCSFVDGSIKIIN